MFVKGLENVKNLMLRVREINVTPVPILYSHAAKNNITKFTKKKKMYQIDTKDECRLILQQKYCFITCTSYVCTFQAQTPIITLSRATTIVTARNNNHLGNWATSNLPVATLGFLTAG